MIIAAMVITGLFGVTPDAHASWIGDALTNVGLAAVGGIVYIWVSLLGQLAVQLVYLIIYLASYNNFVHSSAVENGWVIIRDVVNMFFIVVLLIIAFATIFNVKEYKYQAMLPRLLIMAVVINFSRTICGILIDFGQVVMLTFVNGFQAAAGGNFMKALKIEELMKFRVGGAAQPDDATPGKVLVSLFLAAVMITVTVVVLGAFAIMLVMRMVALWFLVVLSPLAFITSVWPSGRLKANYGKWWDMFLDNIMVGPILAFFLWLSLLVLGNGTAGKDEVMAGGTYKAADEAGTNQPSAGYTQIGTTENMLSYLIGIGMLIGSLAMAQNMRSAGGGIAGAALGKIQGYAKAGVRGVAALPVKGVRKAAGAAYEKSGMRANVSALGTVIQGSKFGKAVGLGTKEYKDMNKAKRDEAALRRFGQTDKANALLTKLEDAERDGISKKGLTNEQVRQKWDSSTDKIQKGALAKELASRGELTSHSQFEKYAQGDRRLDFALRTSSYKTGNKQAFLGYQEEGKYLDPEKQFRGILDKTTNKGQRQAQFVGIKAGAELDENGKMYQEFTHKMIGALRQDEYAEFAPAKRKEIDDALLLTHNNVKDPAEKAKLEKKYDELHGVTAGTAGSWTGAVSGPALMVRQAELVKEQEQHVLEKRKGAQEAGVLKKSDVDVVTEQALTSGIEPGKFKDDKWASGLSDDMNAQLSAISNINAGNAAAIATAVDGIVTALERKAADLDAVDPRTGQHAEDGHEMNHREVLDRSRIYQNAKSAQTLTRDMATTSAPGGATPGVIDEKAKSAASNAMGVSARDMNEAVLRKLGVYTDPKYVKAAADFKKAESKGRGMLDKAMKNTDATKRAEEAKAALHRMASALRVLEKQGSSFPNLETDIAALQLEIERLKDKGAEVSQTEADALKKGFDNIRGGRLA